MTEVVAAFIQDDVGGFLICQRPANKARPLLWEFVGGKIDPGESPEDALVRECREELGIGIAVGKLKSQVCYSYPDLTIRLSLFEARIIEGEPVLLEHQDMRWIRLEESSEYQFCPADREMLGELVSGVTPHCSVV